MNAQMRDFQVQFERMAMIKAIDRADNAAMTHDHGLIFSAGAQSVGQSPQRAADTVNHLRHRLPAGRRYRGHIGEIVVVGRVRRDVPFALPDKRSEILFVERRVDHRRFLNAKLLLQECSGSLCAWKFGSNPCLAIARQKLCGLLEKVVASLVDQSIAAIGDAVLTGHRRMAHEVEGQ